MQGHDAFEKHQKKLFKAIEHEISLYNLMGKNEILSYQKNFNKNFSKRTTSSTKKKLIQATKKAKIILVGDFHPFKQSQKGFIRLLEGCVTEKQKIAVALECIQQKSQKKVDEFLKNHITISELREEIHFDEHWPFPWENYKEILLFAKKNGLQIIALNILERKRSSQTLLERDFAAAQSIKNHIHHFDKIFVLIGELHLAQRHLPHSIKKASPKSTILTIHQNIPQIYWSAPKTNQGARPEVVKLNSKEFCILNAVPWVKQKSYLDWIEGSVDDEEHIADINSEVLELSKLLIKLLKLKKPPLAKIEIIGAEGISSSKRKIKSATDKILFQHCVKFQRSSMLADTNILLVPHNSNNSFFEAASLLTWRSQLNKFRSPETTKSLLLYFFIGYFGSKIFNPKRKCNEVKDIERFLSLRATKKEKMKRKIFLSSIHLLTPYLEMKQRKSTLVMSRALQIEAARISGYILGERLYTAIARSKKKIKIAHEIFSTSNGSEKWVEHSLQKVARAIREVAPLSKKDRL